MSAGMTPYEFVRQVYYMQEKVLLDFWPSDDKYKEVIVEANLVLQELQNAEDWTWLRDRLELGPCTAPFGQIPEFHLPEWVYKVSTLNHDSVKLYRMHPHCHCSHPMHMWYEDGHYSLGDYIQVPIASAGDNQWRKELQFDINGRIHVPDRKLRAAVIGDVLTFNRQLTPNEAHRIAVVDVQRRIRQLHVCDDFCKGADGNAVDYTLNSDGSWKNPCARIEDRVFTEIPDPNYVVIATAARHAEGSPPAQARIQTLVDASQKILSAMRQNDASATDSDYLEWDVPGYIEIV